MPDRIVLEPDEIAGLIRGARLPELREDTPPEVRRRWTDTALTAMDALCGLADRAGTGPVWDVLHALSPREVLAFATLMASELADTGFRASGDTPGGLDVFLAIASRRETRRYARRAIPAEVEERILQAGRLSGSSRNSQPWRFVVVESPQVRERVAGAVWAPDNVLGAALVVAIVVTGRGPLELDAGRAAQNMLLAAWGAGVGACPNGVRDPVAMAAALGLGEREKAAIVLSFGYPARAVDPASRGAGEWIDRADRRPLEELVERR